VFSPSPRRPGWSVPLLGGRGTFRVPTLKGVASRTPMCLNEVMTTTAPFNPDLATDDELAAIAAYDATFGRYEDVAEALGVAADQSVAPLSAALRDWLVNR
jgi:hypothetical protein